MPEPFLGGHRAEYRLYCLDGAGRFTKAHEINADTDEDALIRAREIEHHVSCELWQKDRKVADLQPSKS